MSGRRAIARVQIWNYKSIEFCDVELNPLMILVGPNGSGKSNFLDALEFISDALNETLDVAIRKRGGFQAIMRNDPLGQPFPEIRLRMNLDNGLVANYWLSFRSHSPGMYRISREKCEIFDSKSEKSKIWYEVGEEVGEEKVNSSEPLPPAYSSDNLYLTRMSSVPEFRPVYALLARMEFYNFNPDAMRTFHNPDAGEMLKHDGSNAASVLRKLMKQSPDIKIRLEQYLNAIVPGLIEVDPYVVGVLETLEFKQVVYEYFERKEELDRKFLALSMSDGTLRALGILLALFQYANSEKNRFSIIAIEEPETGLHPKVLRAIFDAVDDAIDHVQVIMTSHSSEILDILEGTDHILAVKLIEGSTVMNKIDSASQHVIDGKFYTPGELLSINQLEPYISENNPELAASGR